MAIIIIIKMNKKLNKSRCWYDITIITTDKNVFYLFLSSTIFILQSIIIIFFDLKFFLKKYITFYYNNKYINY